MIISRTAIVIAVINDDCDDYDSKVSYFLHICILLTIVYISSVLIALL